MVKGRDWEQDRGCLACFPGFERSCAFYPHAQTDAYTGSRTVGRMYGRTDILRYLRTCQIEQSRQTWRSVVDSANTCSLQECVPEGLRQLCDTCFFQTIPMNAGDRARVAETNAESPTMCATPSFLCPRHRILKSVHCPHVVLLIQSCSRFFSIMCLQPPLLDATSRLIHLACGTNGVRLANSL